MSREELIEEAAKAMVAASGDETWEDCEKELYLADAEVALAVFEKAQAKPKRDTPHPLADYIASEIHGEDETIMVHESSVQGDGLSVYLEGEHIDRGDFSAVVTITEFHFVEEL